MQFSSRARAFFCFLTLALPCFDHAALGTPAVTVPSGSPIVSNSPFIEGSKLDPLDIAQGGSATSSSVHAAYGAGTVPDDPKTAIGGSVNWQPLEPANLVYDDSAAAGPVDVLNLTAAAPFDLHRYDIYLGDDVNGQRATSHWELYAGAAQNVLTLVGSGDLGGPFLSKYGALEVDVSDEVSLSGVQYVQLRTTRSIASIGTRVIEVDANVPEPTSPLALAVMGSVLLLRRMRRRRDRY
jgi:hypothetical protein